MTTWICTRTNELSHHGIKGMKWGIRRFQNKDGSLTPAGRRRYDDGINDKQYGKADVKKQTKSNEKTYKIPKNKSLHRLQLEEKYRKQGLSQEQAEQQAAKRIRTEKYVAAAAAVTVASCVAYTKYKGYTSDKIFETNTEFQRIMKLAENAEIRQGRQYLAVDKKDKVKYKGFLGSSFETQIKAQNKINDVFNEKAVKEAVYDVTVKNKDTVKVASRKRAEDAFMKLYNEDSEFRKALQERAKETTEDMGFLKPFSKKLGEGKLEKHQLRKYGYDIFNTLLVDTDKRSESNANKFYDALKKQGMNALEDINDKKYSGYNAKMPIITFDGNFDYVKREMSKSEIMSNDKKATDMITRPALIKGGAAFIGMYAAVPITSKMAVDKGVLKYKEEHPNTEMSDAEIRDMVKKELSNQ